MAGELALKLDAHTNNTSLVLAIELGEGGKVLLFPGDAQIGNWLSWQDLAWGAGEARFTANDLLARTVLYKVGHHGSHNATLRENGLERMTSPQLAAVIPVDTETARKQRWHMPYEPLHERLLALTEGRVILSDAGLPPVAAGDRLSRFRSQVAQDDLYVDVTIMG
jgi:beta-lactamase superfamily II metal-dependent hydrolase